MPPCIARFKSARHAALVVSALAVLTATAMAADPPRPDTASGRFTMHPADGGFLRLDTQTGQMSMCQRSGGAWACNSLPDERLALERENQELKNSVKRLEDMAGVGEPRQSEKSPMAKLPTEDDVDKAMSYVQRMLKKFKDKVRELEDMDKKGTNL
jgi:hypothetical protein